MVGRLGGAKDISERLFAKGLFVFPLQVQLSVLQLLFLCRGWCLACFQIGMF